MGSMKPVNSGNSREPHDLRTSGSPAGGAVLSTWPEPAGHQRREVPPRQTMWSLSGEPVAEGECGAWVGLLCGGTLALGAPWALAGKRQVPVQHRACRVFPSPPQPTFCLSRLLNTPDVLTWACFLAAGTLLFVIVNKFPSPFKCPRQRTSCLSFRVTHLAGCPTRLAPSPLSSPPTHCCDAK